LNKKKKGTGAALAGRREKKTTGPFFYLLPTEGERKRKEG